MELHVRFTIQFVQHPVASATFNAFVTHDIKPYREYGKIDNLHISYDGNRITTVLEDADAVTQNGSMDYPGKNREMAFEYNEWGALVKDESRGIKDSSYDNFGNPVRIDFADGSYTENVYSATGEKLKATHVTMLNGTISAKTTMEYRGNMIYEDGRLNKILVDGGYVDYNGGNPVYNAYLTDHQGNIRMVVSEGAAVRQVDVYYPYGALMAAGPGVNVQRYMYNGKELDRMHGLDWYDYGARHYDAAIGRWHSMDDMCYLYYDISPYAYCGGDPVNAIDPNGNVVIFINGMHMNSGGKSEYWNDVDETIMSWLHDNSARYYDGSCGGVINTATTGALTGNLNPIVRKSAGYKMGKHHAKEIYDNLTEKETIKIVAHSMGPAYAKGFILGLQSYAKEKGIESRIELELDLAPFQPSLQKANPDVQTTTVSHWRDGIAGPSFMKGATNFRTGFWKFRILPTTEHSISSFNEEIHQFIPEGNPDRGGKKIKWEQNGDN